MKNTDKISLQQAVIKGNDIKSNLKRLKKSNPKLLDKIFHKNHREEFSKMNCLDCANCCKTTSPIFKDSDIKRISKKMKIKEINFIEKYLFLDEDLDYVLKTSPCVFLGKNNECEIYDYRPLACRKYPHTDRKNIYQIVDLTIENTKICPVVARITLKLST